MAKPRVIIADNDINYIIPLQYRFIDEYLNRIDIEIITDTDYFSKLFSKPQRVDILIISEQLYDNSLQRHNITNIFLMTERNEDKSRDELNITSIFKYSSIKEIFSVIVGKSGIDPVINKERSTQVIYVCSASGGTGKTALAMAISSCLAKNYKKVLYINAGHLHSFQRLLKDDSAIISTDIYAKLITGSKDIYHDIKPAIRNEGFSYLPPFKAALISLGIPFSIYENIIVSAKKNNDYDYIVIDSDAPFDENNIQLLNISDKVIVVVEQTRASVYATNVFVSNINGASSDKYIFVCNNYYKDRNDAFVSPGIKPKFSISERVGHIENFDQLSFDELSNDSGIQKVAFLIL